MPDGSYKDHHGTLAYVIEIEDVDNRIIGTNILPGHLNDQSALWSKLECHYGVVLTMNAICEEHNITEGSMEIGWNNIKALRYAIDLDYSIALNHTYFDLTTAICSQLKASPMQCKAHHVGVSGQKPFRNWTDG